MEIKMQKQVHSLFSISPAQYIPCGGKQSHWRPTGLQASGTGGAVLEEVAAVKHCSLQHGPSSNHIWSSLERNGKTTKILSLHISWICSCQHDNREVWKQSWASSKAVSIIFQWKLWWAYKLNAGDHLLPWETEPEDWDVLLLLAWGAAIQCSIQKLPGQNT